MYKEGIYVIGFFYRVVGKGLAASGSSFRPRTEPAHIEKAIAASPRSQEVRHPAQDQGRGHRQVRSLTLTITASRGGFGRPWRLPRRADALRTDDALFTQRY